MSKMKQRYKTNWKFLICQQISVQVHKILEVQQESFRSVLFCVLQSILLFQIVNCQKIAPLLTNQIAVIFSYT
jgi:hypothetical protein